MSPLRWRMEQWIAACSLSLLGLAVALRILARRWDRELTLGGAR